MSSSLSVDFPRLSSVSQFAANIPTFIRKDRQRDVEATGIPTVDAEATESAYDTAVASDAATTAAAESSEEATPEEATSSATGDVTEANAAIRNIAGFTGVLAACALLL